MTIDQSIPREQRATNKNWRPPIEYTRFFSRRRGKICAFVVVAAAAAAQAVAAAAAAAQAVAAAAAAAAAAENAAVSRFPKLQQGGLLIPIRGKSSRYFPIGHRNSDINAERERMRERERGERERD